MSHVLLVPVLLWFGLQWTNGKLVDGKVRSLRIGRQTPVASTQMVVCHVKRKSMVNFAGQKKHLDKKRHRRRFLSDYIANVR